MRETVIDTETTGLHPLDAHRIVAIGAVESCKEMTTYGGSRVKVQMLGPGSLVTFSMRADFRFNREFS